MVSLSMNPYCVKELIHFNTSDIFNWSHLRLTVRFCLHWSLRSSCKLCTTGFSILQTWYAAETMMGTQSSIPLQICPALYWYSVTRRLALLAWSWNLIDAKSLMFCVLSYYKIEQDIWCHIVYAGCTTSVSSYIIISDWCGPIRLGGAFSVSTNT